MNRTFLADTPITGIHALTRSPTSHIPSCSDYSPSLCACVCIWVCSGVLVCSGLCARMWSRSNGCPNVMCVWERERERGIVCVCECVFLCVYLYAFVWNWEYELMPNANLCATDIRYVQVTKCFCACAGNYVVMHQPKGFNARTIFFNGYNSLNS